MSWAVTRVKARWASVGMPEAVEHRSGERGSLPPSIRPVEAAASVDTHQSPQEFPTRSSLGLPCHSSTIH